MPLILGTNSIKDTVYNVNNSLRFNDDSTDYLSRTPSSAGDRQKFTISFWIKRANILSTNMQIMTCGTYSSGNNISNLGIRNTGELYIGAGVYGVSTDFNSDSIAVLKDPSAWYHFVVAFDTTQSTESNRIKVYQNGILQSQDGLSSNDSYKYPTQNFETAFNNNVAQTIGTTNNFLSEDLDGYLAEFVMIDGQQLDQTSFGEFDSDSPTIWKPKDVSELTFGTNGFYLEFKQTGTSQNSSGIGADTSGQDNHFAVNNLTALDQSTDTCTNNFCTLNSISPTTDITLSEGNLKAVYGTSGTRTVKTSTFGLSAGKWYWEIKIGGSTSPNNAMVGITQLSTDTNTVLGTADNSWTYRGYDGKVYHNNADEGGSLDTFAGGDIIGIALNLDNLQGSLHKLYFSKNGTFQNGADPTDFTSTTGVYGIDDNVDYFPAISDAGSSATPQFEMNFGSPSHSISSGNTDGNGHGNFEYAPPTGFFSLCSSNLAEFG